jgi:hypothetical protein
MLGPALIQGRLEFSLPGYLRPVHIERYFKPILFALVHLSARRGCGLLCLGRSASQPASQVSPVRQKCSVTRKGPHHPGNRQCFCGFAREVWLTTGAGSTRAGRERYGASGLAR